MSSITDVYSPRTTFRCTRLRGAKVGSSVCQFCAVGCSQLGFFKDGKLIDVEGDPRSAVNEGRLCPKGSSTYALNDNPYRKVKPMYRAPGSDHWEEVTLDWMLDTVAKRIWDTRNKGFVEKDPATGITVNNCANIGFIGGSANDNEECYLFRKLFTGGLGILPVENSARYCHSTTVAALSPTFGFGACTNPPRDLLNSDCILIMGSNMAEAHPCAFYWPMQAKKKGAVTIHVDPRYTRTSAACDHHVHIRPETDIAFLSAVIRYILEKGLWFKEYVLAYTNASTIINSKFNFNDVTGLFNGWDPATRSYSKEPDSWDYVPFAAVAIGAGAPPLMVAVCFAIFSNFMWGITEYAGGPGPIYFGQGFFERPRFYKINFILVTVSVLIVFTIGMLWWKLIGLY